MFQVTWPPRRKELIEIDHGYMLYKQQCYISYTSSLLAMKRTVQWPLKQGPLSSPEFYFALNAKATKSTAVTKINTVADIYKHRKWKLKRGVWNENDGKRWKKSHVFICLVRLHSNCSSFELNRAAYLNGRLKIWFCFVSHRPAVFINAF